MLLPWDRVGWMLRDVGEGGGGTAVADAPVEGAETEPGAEVVEEVVEEEAPAAEVPAEEPAEEEPETPEGEEPAEDLTTPAGRAFAAMRRENRELRERLGTLEGRVGEVSETVSKSQPPAKDPLITYAEGLPAGKDPDKYPDATLEEHAAFNKKQDAMLLAGNMSDPDFRRAFLEPILQPIRALFQSFDLNSWQMEQMVDAFEKLSGVELGAPEVDANGNVVKPAKKFGDLLPPGLKNRKEILDHHKQAVNKNGGKWVPVRSAADEFSKLKDQAAKESGKAATEAAASATKRTLKTIEQRRTATGGPRSVAVPARGATGRPGKRTPEQIEKAGVDFVIP